VTQHSRDTPQFYLTAPSPCPYLPGRHERKVFTHLVGDKAADLNDLLTHGGFRRSQSIAYRPACDQCRACVSVRVMDIELRTWYGAPGYFVLGAMHAVLFWVSVSFLTPFVVLVGLFNGRRRLLHDIVLGTVVINSLGRTQAAQPART